MSKENDDLDFLADDYDQPSRDSPRTSSRRSSIRPRIILKKTGSSSSNLTGRRESLNSNDELTLDQIQSPTSSSSTDSPPTQTSQEEKVTNQRSGSKIVIGSKNIQKTTNNSLITETSSKVQTKKFMSNLLKSVQSTSQPSSPTIEPTNVSNSTTNGSTSTEQGIVIDETEEKRRNFEMMNASNSSSRRLIVGGDDKKQITLDKLESLMQTLDRHDRVPLLDENINIIDLYSSDPSQIDAKQGIIKSNPPLFQKHDQPLDIDLFEEITSFSTIQRRYLSQDEMVKGDFKTSHEFQLKPNVGNLSSAVDDVREFVKKEKERHQIMMGEDQKTNNESSSSLLSGSASANNSSSADLKSNLEKQVEHESHMEKAKKIFRKIEYRHVFKDLVNRLIMEKIGIPTILRVNSKFIAVGTSNGLIVLYHRKTENRLAILGSIQNEEITNLSGGKVTRPVQVTALDFGSKMTLPYEEYTAKSEQDLLMLYYRISTDQDDYTVNATTGGDRQQQQDEENIEVLSQTSRVLVSGHSDGSINIWNLSTFRPVKPLKGYFTKPVQKIVNLHKTSKQYNAIEFLAVDTSGRMKLFNVRKIMFAYYVDVQPILWASIPKEMSSFKQTNLESENGESTASSQLILSSMTPEQQLKMKEVEKRQQQEKILSTFTEFQVLPKSEGRHPLDRFVLVAVATESEVTIHSVKPSSKQIATLYNNSVLDMASGAASSAGSFMRKKITPKIAWKASQMVDGDHRGLTVSLNDQTNPYLAVAWGNRIAFYHVEVQQPSSFFNFMFGGNSNPSTPNGQANTNGTQNGSSQNGNSNSNTQNGSPNMNVNMGGSDLPNIYFASEMFVPFNVEHIHWLSDDLFIVLDSKQSKMLLIDRKLESSTNWIEEVNCKELMLDYISDPMMNIPTNLKKKYGLQYGGGFTRGSFDVSAFQYIEILRHSSITPQSLKHSIYNSSDSDDTVSIPSTTHSFATEMYRASYGGGVVTVKHRSPTIYMLGASELRAMRCLSWDERVVALQTIGEYEEALNMSVEMFNDPTSIGALIGLPNKEEFQRHQAVSTLISSILVDYRDTKLHQLQLDNGLTHQKVESLVQVARNCLQRAIEINDIELIEGTFMSFEHYGCEHIFFQLLVEELILNGALSRMMTIDSKKASYDFIQSQFMKIKDLYTSDADPEKGEKGLIDLSRYIKYHNNIENEISYDSSSIHPLSPKVRFERLESIILNLDISKLDIDYEVFLELNEKCKRYNLYRMHIYANCVLNSDYITPVRDYLEDITISDLTSIETKEKADSILEYFKNIVTKGTIFTDAYHITDPDVLKKVKRLIVDFLFEQTRIARQSSNSQEKLKNNGVAMLNLEKLIKYNPKETFDVLKLYFEEIAIEGSVVTSPFYITFPRPIKNPLTKEERESILEEFIVTSFADCVNEGTSSNMSLRKWVPKLNREELIEAMKSYMLDPPQGELDIEIDSPTFTLREKKYLYEFLGEMIARNILAEDKGQIKRIYTHLCHDNVFTSDETKELLKQFKEHEKASTETKKSKSVHLTEQARQESIERIMKQTSYLTERKEYLIKEYDFKRHRQNILMKILEKLESSNEQTITTILVRLIDYAQENNCYQTAVYLNRKKKDYKAVIKNYIDDLKLKKAIGYSQIDTPVFSYISELANDSEVITISIHDAILDHFLDLMRADSEEMTLLIVKYFPTLHPQVLNTLITSSIKHIEDEKLLFNYLSKIINIYEGNNDIIDVKANTSASTMSQFFTSMTRTKIDVDMELQYQYIRLLCKFEPHKVCDWLQTHQFPGEKAEEILEYCRNIPDAVSFLLERNGEVMEALNIVLKNISRETSILEETLSNISKKFDPENIRFSKYRHVKDIKERSRLQKGITYTDAEEQAEQHGIKFFNVERMLGLVDLEEIPLDVYLDARKKVLDGRGLLPNASTLDKDDSSVAVNPLHYGLDEEFIGRGSIFLQVEDLPESKKIRKELAVAISMCKRNTQRKTVDEKQVKQLWFKLLDQFNLPFSEYFKAYKLGIEDPSVKRDEEGGDGERLQANEETDVEKLKSKIEQTRALRKSKEAELLEKEKEFNDCADEEEKKSIQKSIDNSKKYIAQQTKREKTIQKQIQDIRDKSKMEKEKSNQMHNLAKLWLQLLEFKLLRVVVLSAIGSLPIPEILKKLTKENAKSDFSMYRQILLHLLDKYKYDLKLLQNANNVVEEDTFTLSKKFTDRLMRGLSPTVPKCMLTDTLLTPEVDDNEDEEKTNSKKGRREKKFDVIRLFDTGYAYRLSALGNVTRCPTTTTSVKKKKFEVEKTKSITEVKKITNELSRLSQVESQVKKKPTMKLYRTALKESQMVRSNTKKAGSLDLVFSGLERPLLPPIAEELTNVVPNLFVTTTSRDISASNVETNVENAIVFDGRYVSQEQIIDTLLDNAIQF